MLVKQQTHLFVVPHMVASGKLVSTVEYPLELGVMQSCTSVIFFEVRKRQDLYLWFSKTPDGPSAKFHVANSEWGQRALQPPLQQERVQHADKLQAVLS
jgi:hypothetical protein